MMSEEGVQQGDPLGPLLFCLAIKPLLDGVSSEFNIGYLDDITIGGQREGVLTDVQNIVGGAAAMGLVLNKGKSELLGASQETAQLSRDAALDFVVVGLEGLSFRCNLVH